jgi:hypothetical protein
MYETDFVCTYKSFEDLAGDDSGMMYQAQFLQAFGITEYSDDAIRAGLEQIKTKSDEVPELKALILRHPYNLDNADNADNADNLDDLLPLMFAYPLLDVFHLCLIDAFRTGCISAERRDKVLHVYSSL